MSELGMAEVELKPVLSEREGNTPGSVAAHTHVYAYDIVLDLNKCACGDIRK